MQKTARPGFYRLILCAFLLNVILPFFAVYTPPANHTDIQRLSSVYGGQILICTGDGFKWVKLADLQSGKEKPKPHPGYKCPLCYAAAHGMMAFMAAAPAVSYESRRADTRVITYNSLLVYSSLPSPLHIRAPPVSFIG